MKIFMKRFRQFSHFLVITLTPKFLRAKMNSCEQIAIYIANSDQHNLSTKFQIRVHNLMCQQCHDFKTQVDMINKACGPMKKVELTSEQKEKIQNSKQAMINKFR